MSGFSQKIDDRWSCKSPRIRTENSVDGFGVPEAEPVARRCILEFGSNRAVREVSEGDREEERRWGHSFNAEGIWINNQGQG
jgi:hypothetical protein